MMQVARLQIVEDERIIAHGLSQTLIGLGYQVVGIASSGENAIQKAEELEPDLVLMDIVLKGEMDGIEAAEEIRTRLGIPSIFMTAYDDDAILKRAKISEPYAYILKPFEERGLHANIQLALYRHQLEKQLKQAQQALRKANEELEERVEERTVELSSANAQLQREIAERRRAEDELQQHASNLAILNEIGQQVAAFLDLDQLFERAAQLIQEHFGFSYVGLFTKDTGEDRQVLRASAGDCSAHRPDLAVTQALIGESDRSGTTASSRKLVQPVAGSPISLVDKVGMHGEILLAKAAGAGAPSNDRRPDRQPPQSELFVPIDIGGEIVGVLELHSSHPSAFNSSNMTTLETLADQLAVAINNARLYSQTTQHNRELSLLNRVLAITAAGEALESTLEAVCQEVALAFELPWVDVTLFDEKNAVATIVAECLPPGHLPSLGEEIQVADNAAFQHLLTRKRSLVIEEAQTDARLQPIHDMLRKRGTVSLLFLPLIVNDRTVGSLGVYADELRVFTAQEMNLLWRIAEQVSGLLTRKRLQEEHRQMEEQFHQAQKMEAIGRVTGGIAHDFNNLLTVVLLGTRIISRRLEPGDPLLQHLRPIENATERATGLIKQLLAFSRSEVPEPQVLNLNQVLNELDQMLQRLIGEDIQLTMRLSDDLWPIKIDPTRIEQAVVNLAVNARDATPNGGKLTIETTNVLVGNDLAGHHLEALPGEYVLLTVSDNGIGMSDEVKSHLFEPFYTTKERGKGTGLGLASVYGIVKQSKGFIQVYSKANKGTAFQIYLPRVSADISTLSQGAPAATVSQARGSESVLLVEDEAPVRELMRGVLTIQGYKVLVAQDGVDALEVARNHQGPIHLLLTDVVMPRLSGRELADRLQPDRPEMQVLFISGYTGDALMHHSMSGERVHFLPKPFKPDTLARKVRDVLDGAA